MPSLEEIVVKIRVPAADGIIEMIRFGAATKQTTFSVEQLNKALGRTSGEGTRRAMIGSIGAFYAYRMAMGTLSTVLRTSEKEAANLESTMIRLRATTGISGSDLSRLRMQSYGIAGGLGPERPVDIMRNIELMSTVAGHSTDKYASFNKQIATIASNMQLFSDMTIDAEGAMKNLREVMGAWGGFNNPNLERILNLYHGLVVGFTPKEPGRALASMRSATGMAKIVGMPPEDLFALAAQMIAVPTSGRMAGGRDIEALIFASLNAANKVEPKHHLKGGMSARAALTKLGVLTPDGKSAGLVDGKFDLVHLLSSIEEHTANMSVAEKIKLYGAGFSSDKLARRMAMARSDSSDLQALIAARRRLLDLLDKGPYKMAEEAQSGTTGRASQLGSNLMTIGGQIFSFPNRVLGRVAGVAADATGGLSQDLAGSKGLRGLGLLTGTGLSAMVLQVMTKFGFVQTILTTIGEAIFGSTATAFLGRILSTVLLGGPWAAAIGATFIAAIELYKHSSFFQTAVDSIFSVMKGLFSGAWGIANQLGGMSGKEGQYIPPPPKAHDYSMRDRALRMSLDPSQPMSSAYTGVGGGSWSVTTGQRAAINSRRMARGLADQLSEITDSIYRATGNVHTTGNIRGRVSGMP